MLISRLQSAVVSAAFLVTASGPALASIQPVELLTAYGFKSVRTTATGAGQTIAVYVPTGSTYAGLQADLDQFSSTYVSAGSTTLSYYYADALTNYGVSGYSRTPTATTASAEAALDIQYAHYIAPLAKIVVVSGDNTAAAAQFAATKLGASVFTTSFAGYETNLSQSDVNTYNVRYGKANAAGMQIYGAVGDSSHYDYPASSPYAIGVGGTNLTVTSSDTRSKETSWDTGGGGQSVYNAEPTWQYAVQNSAFKQGPDVSIAGGDASAMPVVIGGDISYHYGSSISSPIWSGLGALIQQARVNAGKDTLSTTELMTLFYGSYGTSDYSKLFYDVTTTATGGVLKAGPGFDMVTGLGVPNVPYMLSYLASVPEPASLAVFGTVAVAVMRRRRA